MIAERKVIQFSPYVQIHHVLGRLYSVWLVVGNQAWCVTPEPYENHEFDQAEMTAKHITNALLTICKESIRESFQERNDAMVAADLLRSKRAELDEQIKVWASELRKYVEGEHTYQAMLNLVDEMRESTAGGAL